MSGTVVIVYEAVVCLLVLLSAFFSASETALVSSRRISIETLARKGNRGAERALFLINNLEDAISTVLIGNNIVNIAATACITYLAATAFALNDRALFAVTAVQTIVFLIFCEMTPKIFAKAKAEHLLIAISLPIKCLLVLLKPLNFVSVTFAGGVKRLFHIEEADGTGIVRSRDELDILFQIGKKEGAIDEEHHEYISGMLSFNKITAKEIMTPMVDIRSVEIGASIKSLVQLIVSTRYSRIPIFEKRVDNIVGFVFYRDILKHKKVTEIKDLLRPAVYVPDTKNIFRLFTEMRETENQMVFVVNEYGGVIGLVTHEDIAEEIVGEIQTVDHGREGVIQKISDLEYLLDGDVDIDRFNKIFFAGIEPRGFETLAGFMLYKMGHIPQKGESFIYGKLVFTAEDVQERFVEKISIKSKNTRKIKAAPLPQTK